MKYALIVAILLCTYSYTSTKSADILHKYKPYLEDWTYKCQDWSDLDELPASRYKTFKIVFNHFEKNNGKIVVELGTTRSFTHGGHEGCNRDNPKYWMPNKPEFWDWGAGSFTRVAAECLVHLNPTFHTVDLASTHINRCKVITKDFAHIMHYHTTSSLNFLRNFNGKIDLLYLDTGNMTPIEPTALLQLNEAKTIVERNLLSDNGILLIDDVRNRTPKVFGEKSDLGKSKYSIPYLLEHGFEIVEAGYQFVLRKKATSDN